jgi:DNA segregation ATPase FtsK/SpoIIIE, S-DNA-T family
MAVVNIDAGPYRDMLLDAVRVVVPSQIATQNQLQRRVHCGFATAGRLLTLLANAGVISEAKAGGPRDVLVPRDRLDETLATLATAPSEATR